MSDWALIIYCGLITFLTRFSMIALLKKEMFNDRIREVLSFVPSAIFPAIIFPAIFLDNSGLLQFENNPKILASIIAVIVGMLSKNIIATIVAGLAAYWFLIFI
ncbi:AzlD domain-containing protein [Candidatus Pelagibacter sp.]|jgi:branched-subunit amino acid transport protein|nr:AzlD domain-containing protein [Candidatus Pelagibacter sp.]|tara:strand:- start:248 stop:559 length:312 start_codon:yes stop_codon:yes gene_type:complete